MSMPISDKVSSLWAPIVIAINWVFYSLLVLIVVKLVGAINAK
jgi:hypothetical protein